MFFQGNLDAQILNLNTLSVISFPHREIRDVPKWLRLTWYDLSFTFQDLSQWA